MSHVRQVTDYFEDESLQAVDCFGTSLIVLETTVLVPRPLETEILQYSLGLEVLVSAVFESGQ